LHETLQKIFFGGDEVRKVLFGRQGFNQVVYIGVVLVLLNYSYEYLCHMNDAFGHEVFPIQAGMKWGKNLTRYEVLARSFEF